MAKTILENNYVSVQNGVVISVFNGRDLPEYNEKMLDIIDVTNVVPKPQLNWNYFGGEFIELTTLETDETADDETVELDDLAKLKLDYIKQILGDVEYMGNTFNFETNTYSIMSGYAAFGNLNSKLPDNFYWLNKNNEKVFMSLEEFKGFCDLAANLVFTSFNEYVGKRAVL